MQSIRGRLESLHQIIQSQVAGRDAVISREYLFDNRSRTRRKMTALVGLVKNFPTLLLRKPSRGRRRPQSGNEHAGAYRDSTPCARAEHSSLKGRARHSVRAAREENTSNFKRF